MTLDKAIKDLEIEYKSDYNRQIAEWLKELKKFREQQSEDAISREDAIMCMTGEYLADKEYKLEDIISKHIQRLRALPPVRPMQKVGYWIPLEYDAYADGNPVWNKWECSECGYEEHGESDMLTCFCPYCGAEMLEPESEE